MSDVVDHIDHVVKLAGIDYVGIGTDFDGGGGVADCRDVSEMGNITLELVRRGYTEDQIRKIWGGNFLRVFREVEQLGETEFAEGQDRLAKQRPTTNTLTPRGPIGLMGRIGPIGK